MSDTIRCPSCTHPNEAGAATCANCNFPLRDGAPQPMPEPSAPRPAAPKPAAEEIPAVDIRRVRPIRPRRPKPADQAL